MHNEKITVWRLSADGSLSEPMPVSEAPDYVRRVAFSKLAAGAHNGYVVCGSVTYVWQG